MAIGVVAADCLRPGAGSRSLPARSARVGATAFDYEADRDQRPNTARGDGSSPSASTGRTARRTSCSSACGRECPVHWTSRITEYPRGGRVLVGDHGRRRPRGQPRLGDLLVRARRHHRADRRDHAARADPGDVHRHGPAEARPAQDAVPARVHAEADRRARGRDPGDHHRRARPARRSRDLRPGHRGRPARGLPRDRELHGDPAGGRRDLGAADEHDARRGRSRPQSRGRRGGDEARRAGDLRALRAADRRAARAADRRPHQRARPRRDRRRAARGARDRDGLLPAGRRGQRQHQGHLLPAACGRCSSTPTSGSCCSTIPR